VSRRPYFHSSGAELEKLFEASKNTPETLRELLDELQYRKTARMVALRGKIQDSLAKQGQQIPTASSNVLCPDNRPGRTGEPLKGGDGANVATVSPPRRSSAPSSETWSESSPPSPPERPRVAETPEPTAQEAVDPPPTLRPATIRPPGKLSGLPEKFHFDLKHDIKLGQDPNAPLIVRYESALKALIGEMRRKGAGAKQVMLEDGVRVGLDTREVGYEFPYDGEADLFESASVVALMDGRPIEGRIAAVLEKRLIVGLQTDLGPRIPRCVLRVDNTAMLEALRARLEKIHKGEVPSFNLRLADAVLRNHGDERPPASMAGEITQGLNACQAEAVKKIASNEVLYLWGPPGTGKTQTLSAVTLAMLQSGKRVLLCSNTNQAVDQVLLKLCKRLTRAHPVIEEGQVLRIGKISHAELERDWADVITLPGIVERRSVELRAQLRELERQIDDINRETKRYSDLMGLFHELDTLEAALTRLRHEHAELQKNVRDLSARKREAEETLAERHAERDKIRTSGFTRIFRRSEEAVLRDIQTAETDVATYAGQLDAAKQPILEHGMTLHAYEKNVENARAGIAGQDRAAVQKNLDEADTRKQPLTEAIAEINRQLDDLAKAVIEQAKIVGATVTKAYLSPQHFTNFHVVIVDEASMVLLPALFHNAGLATDTVVVSGDFRQLPPIVPTEQKEIAEILSADAFHAAGVAKAFSAEQAPKRGVMLTEQYRMQNEICRIISTKMYRGRLKTAATVTAGAVTPPAPFERSLTVIDTSTIAPFSSRDPFKSRYNLMHALAVRNLCFHFNQHEFNKVGQVGVCTPYAAQAKVIKRVLDGAGLGFAEAGTVHRYQGDEKVAMVLDIPDSYGDANVGVFLQAEHPDEDGAKLLNVAVSRAKGHLIVLANLAYLDKKLPAHAFLRGMLAEIQARGRVIDVREVLRYWPIVEDLRRYGMAFDLSPEAERTGLFNQRDFEKVCIADCARAQASIAIYSGFVTEQRVASYEHLFRERIAHGVKIRCVTRPPRLNGSIPEESGKAALDGLERFGCVVDTRGDIHEKVVIIDDEIVWFGSLNPLSHTAKTAEVMARLDGKQIALQLAAFLALDKGMKPKPGEGVSVLGENPRCPKCTSRTAYMKGRFGPYWECEGCEWRESTERSARTQRAARALGGSEGPSCPLCGKPTVPRRGNFGAFFGCSDYPKCSGKVSPKRTKGATKGHLK
jgi:ssDNA-binding Zn-finger/Zn-ribbon topoisomerase 1